MGKTTSHIVFTDSFYVSYLPFAFYQMSEKLTYFEVLNSQDILKIKLLFSWLRVRALNMRIYAYSQVRSYSKLTEE